MKKKVIRLTESQLNKIVKSVMNEKYQNLVGPSDDICEIICKRKVAAKGSTGDIVKMIQHLLYVHQYNSKYAGGGMTGDWCYKDWRRCDGIFKGHTEDAVKEFQRSLRDKYGLVVDGIVGYNTWNAMCTTLTYTKSLPKGSFCKDCMCKDKKQDDFDWDERKKRDDDFDWDEFLDKFDCEEIKNCMQKYLFANPVPDFPGFMECINLNANKNKHDMDEGNYADLEKDGFVEGCAWHIRTNDTKGYKYIMQCPTYLNCMPSTNKQNARYCNSKAIQACKAKGCTKITY